eukprot:scaffold82827_cov21-Tisochrysis_lutea.AAC.1
MELTFAIIPTNKVNKALNSTHGMDNGLASSHSHLHSPWTTHYGGGGKVDAPHQLKAHLLASFLCILPAPHLL